MLPYKSWNCQETGDGSTSQRSRWGSTEESASLLGRCSQAVWGRDCLVRVQLLAASQLQQKHFTHRWLASQLGNPSNVVNMLNGVMAVVFSWALYFYLQSLCLLSESHVFLCWSTWLSHASNTLGVALVLLSEFAADLLCMQWLFWELLTQMYKQLGMFLLPLNGHLRKKLCRGII